MSRVLEIEEDCCSINKPISYISVVDRVNSSIAYNDFYTNYLCKNKPCIFDGSLTENWSCRRQWSLDGAPDFDALSLLFGNCVVPVADCNEKYYNSQKKTDMKMDAYLDYWISYIDKNYPSSMPLLYLKDWHCIREYPNAPTYDVPQYFWSDWLNEYHLSNPEIDDDYMFVYMGPKGTWTPLHVDVFTSYSWSANIVGKKRWLLFPPGQEDFLRDTHGQLAYDATLDELKDHTKYKAYDQRILQYIDVVQKEGEVIFIPSGWHHQVWNLEDTISVNHNWINACNIMNVWLGLKKELSSVMKEVEDCKDMNDWPDHCQLMLKTSYGMDYVQFLDFIIFIAENRLKTISKKHKTPNFKKFAFGFNHCLFDLDAIRLVLMDFITDTKEKQIYSVVCQNDAPYKILNDILAAQQSHKIHVGAKEV